MTLQAILSCFLSSIKHSSLKKWSQHLGNVDYRLLIGFFEKAFDPQEIIKNAWLKLFKISGGYLILDEIVIEKASNGKPKFLKRRYKSAGGYVTWSISIVLLIWTDGSLRIPLRFSMGHPEQENPRIRALKLLSWARNHLKWKPECVLFDSGFCCQSIIRRMTDYGWPFVTKIPRNWCFNGIQVWRYKKQGYWNEVGHLSSGDKVFVIRRADKFFLCNRMSWSCKKVIDSYGLRAIIEEVFRILKGECHWKGCQLSRSDKYERFMACSVLSFFVLEFNRIAYFTGETIYKLRQRVMFEDFKLCIPLDDSVLAMT